MYTFQTFFFRSVIIFPFTLSVTIIIIIIITFVVVVASCFFRYSLHDENTNKHYKAGK